eukprot:7900206-Pyramimonas_sp.AAC.1
MQLSRLAVSTAAVPNIFMMARWSVQVNFPSRSRLFCWFCSLGRLGATCRWGFSARGAGHGGGAVVPAPCAGGSMASA